jgi:hypothetical protein
MSQQQTPIDGGIAQIQTAVTTPRVNALSKQYIALKGLEFRPTEWNPAGRPIYDRLPAAGETYRINFFDTVAVPNTAAQVNYEELGYVYIPHGEGIFGPTSAEVVASDDLKDVVIKGGNIVWKYGTTSVIPAVLNLEELGINAGTYLLAYQLLYDDKPFEALYTVTDYALTGESLTIESSTDTLSGWRDPAVNAFLNTSTLFWKNYDSYFPSYLQPTQAYLSWQSELPSAYSEILLRCPANTAVTGEASLYYYNDLTTLWELVTSAPVEKDSAGQYFRLFAFDPSFQSRWKVVWTDTKVSIQSVQVSGTITKLKRPAGPRPRASLVAYPENLVPEVTLDANGVEVRPVYCNLAFVSVSSGFTVEDIRDVRNITHRDFTPISDWLTMPWDNNLIDLYEQVKGYPEFWMSPVTAMKQEYATLPLYDIILSTSNTLGQ